MIHDSGPEDEEEPRPTLLRRTTIGNGPPDSVLDWTKEPDIGLSNQNDNNHAYSRKNWRLLRCQNGKLTVPLQKLLTLPLRIHFEQVKLCDTVTKYPVFYHWQDCASLKNLWRLNTMQEAVVEQ